MVGLYDVCILEIHTKCSTVYTGCAYHVCIFPIFVSELYIYLRNLCSFPLVDPAGLVMAPNHPQILAKFHFFYYGVPSFSAGKRSLSQIYDAEKGSPKSFKQYLGRGMELVCSTM